MGILLSYAHDLFLILRDDNPQIPCPFQWAVLGGGLQTGETADEAIFREILEEVGTQVDGLECIGTAGSSTWYIGYLNGAQAATIKQREGCGRGFLSYAALVGLANIEGKGGLGGSLRIFMKNAPEEIAGFLFGGKRPNLERMWTTYQ